jgi:hypothetical protein
MTKKIALIGSAPSSVALAPYNDPSWQIWGCSPGARPYVRKVDAWFEIHLWEPHQPWFSPEYIDFMAKLPVPVYMLEHIDAIPASVPYPKDDILRLFGPGAVFFYTSSLAWMFALAIASGAKEIGLWGVDMSAGEEVYTHQRAGCQYWIGKAMERGIKVTIPPQSDLLRPTPLYGFREADPMDQKLLARKAELEARIANATNMHENSKVEILQLRGALDDLTYTRATWVQDRLAWDLLTFGEQQPAPQRAIEPYWQSSHPASPAPAAPPTHPHPMDVARDVADLGVPTATVPVTWGSTPAPEFINGLG